MSVRETSREALRIIIENGLLDKMKLRVYSALCEHGPCTAGELFYAMHGKRNPTHSNVTTRLGELRECGIVRELPKRACNISGIKCIVWDIVPGALPVKFEKPIKEKCKTCGGKGYIVSQQTKLF